MNDYFEIDGYKFDNSIIEMFEILDIKTTIRNIEVGFDLCKNKNTGIIYPKNICEGTNCEIILDKKCNENEEYVGNFHTHPSGSEASFADLLSAYIDGIVIILGDKLLFYITKLTPNKKSYDMLYKYYDKYENYKIKYGKLNEELLNEKVVIYKNFLKTSFNVIEIEL